MATEHLGHFARRGQSQARFGQHHRGDAQGAFIVFATGEDRARGIDEGEMSVVAGDGQVPADHLDSFGEQGDAVLESHIA
jgi:hypothetical protein